MSGVLSIIFPNDTVDVQKSSELLYSHQNAEKKSDILVKKLQ